jgi:benzylsuccinate CoA-transferase BbsF subunit
MSVFAILAALQHRHETGEGQWLDFAMYQVGVSTMGDVILDYLINGRPGGLMGNSHPSRAPHGVYRCKGNDEWVAIDIQTEQQWNNFLKIVDAPLLSKSDNFSSEQARKHNEQSLNDHITLATSHWHSKTLAHSLQKAGIPAAPVMNSRDVVTDPHLRERGFFEVVEHPPESGIGKRSYFGRPWKMSKTPAHIRMPAPMLGEHNEKIMRHLLGKTDYEIQRLYEEHVMGKELLEPPTFTPPSYQSQLDDGSLAAVDADYSNNMGIT